MYTDVLAPKSGQNTDSHQYRPPHPLDIAFAAFIRKLIRRSGKSAKQIAAEITAQIGIPVSGFMIEAYTAPTKKWARFPAILVGSFCLATGSDELQRSLLPVRQRKLLELGEAAAEALDAAAQRKLLAKNRGKK